MKVYVEIDDILNLFGCSDWEIDAKETIKEAWYQGELDTLSLTDKEVKFLHSVY